MTGEKQNIEYKTPASEDGFTVIEIMLVVVIIAIVAMVAIPMMTSAAGIQIKSAANIIAADLEYAKSMAIAKQRIYKVVFDASTETYWIEDAGVIIDHPVRKGFPYVINFSGDSRLNKVDIVSANFDSTVEVSFDYLGSPYNGSDNPLNSGVITLAAEATNMTVTVEPVTGFVTITN